MTLRAYKKDWSHREHWRTRYNQVNALKIVKKLSRHFKIGLRENDVYFESYKRGFASYRYYIILPKKDISLGMICHEIGHLLAWKYGYKGHTKKAYKYIERVYKYAIHYLPINELLSIKNYRLLLAYN